MGTGGEFSFGLLFLTGVGLDPLAVTDVALVLLAAFEFHRPSGFA
jgi:uncharacterized membrane protein YphA (DoxX/SURF4 family)